MTKELEAVAVDGRLGYDACPLCAVEAGMRHTFDCPVGLRVQVSRLTASRERMLKALAHIANAEFGAREAARAALSEEP